MGLSICRRPNRYPRIGRCACDLASAGLVTAARAHASTIERDATAEHAAKVAEYERQRAAIEAQLGDLRGFERDHLTRVRAYLESQLSELEALEGAASPLLNSRSQGPVGFVGRPDGGWEPGPHDGVPLPGPGRGDRAESSAPRPRRAGGLSSSSSSIPSVAPSCGGAGPFSTAPPPASPQDSPELFTAAVGGAVPSGSVPTASLPATLADRHRRRCRR